MEASKEDAGFLDKIRPPRLEEAGLENCALPPDLIKEAFRKAAAAVSSVLSDCTNDPLPGEASPSPADDLLGTGSIAQPSEPCAVQKGGIGDGSSGPDLVGSGVPESKEDVIDTLPEENVGGDCVDGLRGLTIGEKDDGGEEEEEAEGPILVEGYLV